jgi:hypothetical protein
MASVICRTMMARTKADMAMAATAHRRAQQTRHDTHGRGTNGWPLSPFARLYNHYAKRPTTTYLNYLYGTGRKASASLPQTDPSGGLVYPSSIVRQSHLPLPHPRHWGSKWLWRTLVLHNLCFAYLRARGSRWLWRLAYPHHLGIWLWRISL